MADVAETPVEDIASLAAALDGVMAGGIAAVIRGTPSKFFPRNGGPAFRLLHPQEGQAAARTGKRISPELIRKNRLEPDGVHRCAATWLPTFEDRPRSWVIFDVDRIPVPGHLAGDWIEDPDAAVEHVQALLPEPFHHATCWWSISSSAAIPSAEGREVVSEFKLKLAFWLDRPLFGNEVKDWMAAEKAPVDPAVFGAVHLIYVARPTFGHGLHDPVPRRSGLLTGQVDTIAVPRVLLKPVPEKPFNAAATFGPIEGLDDLCSTLRERLAGKPHVREHLLQAAGAFVRQHGSDIDHTALVDALEGIAHEHRSRVEVTGYGIDRLVDFVVERARSTDWKPRGRMAQDAVLPPWFGDEAENRFREVNRQRQHLQNWLRRNCTFAMARREIAARREAAFAAAGLV